MLELNGRAHNADTDKLTIKAKLISAPVEWVVRCGVFFTWLDKQSFLYARCISRSRKL